MAEKTINKLESGRASFAYKCAEGVEGKDKKSEYKSYVKKLPMLIKTNGLGSALSFYFANSASNGKVDTKKTYGLVYRHIEKWLKEDNKQLISFEDNKLAKTLLDMDSATYRAVTIEVLAFLTWLRRFADGLASDNE
jgi:CRISPR-associated protein Cmr5